MAYRRGTRCLLAVCSRSMPLLRSYGVEGSTGLSSVDPAPLFFNPQVQNLLKKLTGADLEKVYRRKKEGKRLNPPEYKFVTDEELQKALGEARQKSLNKLQMPPVLKEREPIDEILSLNPELQNYDKTKFVFTDITFGTPERRRLIVVRDLDGTLRKASWEERHRMNETYFPRPGRSVYTPQMFIEANLQDLLGREEYEFILDKACAQFEPDDPQYIALTRRVYDQIDEKKQFDLLRSTRHFGPMVFYLVFNKTVDNVLLEMIQSDRISDAVDLIQLYHIVNADSKSINTKLTDDKMSYIKAFVQLDSSKKSILELAIQSYLDVQKQKEKYDEQIQKAHGQA